MSDRKRFVIVGLGNFGSNVCRVLASHHHEIIALDLDEIAVDRVASFVTRAAVGDGRDKEVLQHLGADDADVGIVGTGDDITSSVLSTLSLLDLGIERLIVKVISDDHGRIMKRIGASDTVFPEKDSAENLAESLSEESVLSYIRLSDGLGLQEITTPEEWHGKTLRELQLPIKFKVSVVGVHHNREQKYEVPPDPDKQLFASDTLLVAGSVEALEFTSELKPN